jgi:putative ABC transport system ATP-binding protein
VIFANDQIADAAYLCVTGRAELRWPNAPAREALSVIGPGQLIGDLAVVTNKARTFDLVATEATTFLRIGAEEFRSVIEHDAAVAVSLLQSVVGHLSGAAELLRVPEHSVRSEDSGHSELSVDQETSQPPTNDT